MDAFNIALLVVGGLTLVLSLFAGVMHDRVYVLSEPLIAVLVGVAIGPDGLGLLVLSEWGDPVVFLEQLSRLTVGLAVMAAALRLPERYFERHLRSVGAILLVGLPLTWVAAAVVVTAVLDAPFWIAVLISAIVTPTDPVVAGTIVTGTVAEWNIPDPVRHFLSIESAGNDGLAYSFVVFPILFLERPPGQALREWILRTMLWEVGAAVVLGAVIGAVAGLVERESSEYELFEETAMLSVTVSFTFAVLGGVKLLGSDGILAAFVAGLLFNRFAAARDEAYEQKVQDTVLRLFTIPVFVAFGLVLPWTQWAALGWVGLAITAGVLVVRRIPMAAAFYWGVPEMDEPLDALFAGWFGPVGIAALFYVALAQRLVGNDLVWTVSTLVIAGSIVAHGVTSTPCTKLYGRAVGRDRTAAETGDESPLFGG